MDAEKRLRDKLSGLCVDWFVASDLNTLSQQISLKLYVVYFKFLLPSITLRNEVLSGQK